MKKRILLFGIIILFSISFIVAVVNLFVSQSPADISAFNLFSVSVSVDSRLNITYNISDPALNLSTIKLYYKTNSTSSDTNFFFANGSLYREGFTEQDYSSNVSELFLFRLSDNQIYPATYNFDQQEMVNLAKIAYDHDDSDTYLKIRFFNVSNIKNFSFFEVYANNQTTTSNTLRIYYCNSSYVGNVNPLTSTFCTNFYNLAATEVFNHTHSAFSNHYVLPFAINTTTGTIGGIYVTETSYFLLRGRDGVNAWNVYYISNISRTDTIQEDTNGGAGVTWTNLAGTIDAHLHQYDGETDSLWYYACANDTLGNQNCTSLRQDLINLGGLPPSSAGIFAPENKSYRGNIFINYTAASSPNEYAITNGYNISLYNFTDDFILSIQNNSENLSYVWDSSEVSDGVYNFHVSGCDTNGLCSTGESDDFIVDNTNPSANSSCESTTVFVNDVLTCSCAASDETSGINSTVYTVNPFTGDSGNYITTCSVTDNAGNSAGSSFSYEVIRHSQSGGGGGGSGTMTVKPNSQNITSVSEEEVLNIITENKTIEISVEENIYLLNVSKVANDSVKIIFSYDNAERQISVGEKIIYEIGENIVTIQLEGIGKDGAILNTFVEKKIPAKDYTWIAFSIIVGVLLTALIVKGIVKIISSKIFSKLFKHKSVSQKIEKKIREAEKFKKKADRLIKESENMKKDSLLKKKALEKLKEANNLMKKSKRLSKQAHRICKNCNISYSKFKFN
jgi:hypothetical protein